MNIKSPYLKPDQILKQRLYTYKNYFWKIEIYYTLDLIYIGSLKYIIEKKYEF